MLIPYRCKWEQELDTIRKESLRLSKELDFSHSKINIYDHQNKQISSRNAILYNDLALTKKAYDEVYNLLVK